MTEEERWLTCTDPEPMRQFICNRTSERKRLLYVAAWFRCGTHRIWDRRSWEAVEVAEQYADGLASDGDFDRAGSGTLMMKAIPIFMGYHYRTFHTQYALLLRDVVGNPFHPVTLDPAWRTPVIRALATAAYEDRSLPSGVLDPDRLAVLSDALEDAGCDNAEILSHLRGPWPHVRGCWALDLLLG